MELSSILRIGLRKNTQDRRDCDLAPFPPGKTPWSLFAFFFKKVTFFRPKKGSPNRLILFLKARLGGSTFRTPKNRCVKLPVSTSMCPPPYFPLAKMNYFSDEGRRTNERRRRTNISDFALPKVRAVALEMWFGVRCVHGWLPDARSKMQFDFQTQFTPMVVNALHIVFTHTHKSQKQLRNAQKQAHDHLNTCS